VLVTADVSQSITCQVTATNGSGSASATSNTITPIAAVDPDAQAFITAAAITNPTQQAALNTLGVDLKGYSIWSKMKALYPIVGGTASQHKYNLKDPRDLDAAFRLVFNGGWTHSANGALPNGTNGYANTFYVPLSNSTLDSAHISFYSRTNIASGCDVGSSNAAFVGGIYFLNRYVVDLRNYINVHGASSIIELTGYARGDGFFCLRRLNSTQIINSRNSINTTYAQNSTVRSGFPIFISVLNNGGSNAFFSDREVAIASIGSGLSDTDAANFYTAVQAFQTTLGRNV
jgi:hypothetical protein